MPDKMKQFSFPKTKRLLSNDQFKSVLDNGRRFSDPDKSGLILYIAKNDCDYPRLGISIGKSHGNAVTRNRLKRLLREAFRQNQDRIPAGFDYLLMLSTQRPKKTDAAQATNNLTYEQAKNSFLAMVNSSLGRHS